MSETETEKERIRNFKQVFYKNLPFLKLTEKHRMEAMQQKTKSAVWLLTLTCIRLKNW